MKKIILSITSISLLFLSNFMVFANDIDYGTIKNETYANQYFDMSLPVPKGWSVQSKAMIENIAERGKDLVVGEDENMRALLNEAEKQSVNLFAFFKYEVGAPVGFNPSLISVAELVAQMPGVKRGSDYLFHVKKFLKMGQVEYTFDKEIFTTTLSGVSFDVMPVEIKAGNNSVYQEYYSTRLKDYVLSFIVTYSNEAEYKELMQHIGKLKLNG